MKHKTNNASKPEVNQVRIEFTNKPITAWGGICTIVAKYMESIGFKNWVTTNIPVTETSPNAKGIYPKILAHFLTVLCGGRRFSHIQWWSNGTDVIRATFGINWLPSTTSVITRFWEKFASEAICNRWTKKLREFSSVIIEAEGISEDNLNLDSSVITRYGDQQGAHRGYNPKKPGRKSHHPLLAFIGSGYVVNLWNRSGDTSSAHQCVAFYDQTRKSLPLKFSIRYVLADSGFYRIKFIKYLEQHGLRYIIAVPFQRCIQNHIIMFSQNVWIPVSKGIDVTELFFQHQAKEWDKPRRYVLVRKDTGLRPDAIGRQPELFKEFVELEHYRYNLMITNADELSPVEVWRELRPRSRDENVIKELKTNYGWDAFNLNSFWATEAVLATIAMLYHNLIHYLLRNLLGNNAKPFGLGTLRMKYFILPAMLGSQGRKSVLRLGVKDKATKGKINYWLLNIPDLALRFNCNAVDPPMAHNSLL